DATVTGVQTCALPISASFNGDGTNRIVATVGRQISFGIQRRPAPKVGARASSGSRAKIPYFGRGPRRTRPFHASADGKPAAGHRSEKRRVGKKCEDKS